jgi:hypothetical protein
VAKPSDRQLEKHIKQSAQDSARVIFTKHARLRMRQRYVNDPMVLEVLRLGSFALPPEPDMKNRTALSNAQVCRGHAGRRGRLRGIPSH